MSFSFGVPSASSAPSTTPSPFAFSSTSDFTFNSTASKETPTPTPTPTLKPTRKSIPTPLPKAKATHPENLADGVEGIVTFPSRGYTSYRFEIVAKDNKLHIWLEDRKTKKQWRTAQLVMKDFVTESLVIPQASFEDYAKCFQSCLEATTSASDFERDLVAAKDGVDAWELRLTLKIRVSTSTWKLTYSFKLPSVPLEPVDLLSAKIRDQEDQIVDLQRQIKDLTVQQEQRGIPTTTQPPLFVRGTLDGQVSSGKIVWKVEGLVLSGKIVFHSSGAIRFTTGGTFVVNVIVRNNNTKNSDTVDLIVNGKIVVSCIDSDASGHHHSTPIYHVLVAAPDDEVLVMYRGNNYALAGSYIVIHELR